MHHSTHTCFMEFAATKSSVPVICCTLFRVCMHDVHTAWKNSTYVWLYSYTNHLLMNVRCGHLRECCIWGLNNEDGKIIKNLNHLLKNKPTCSAWVITTTFNTLRSGIFWPSCRSRNSPPHCWSLICTSSLVLVAPTWQTSENAARIFK